MQSLQWAVASRCWTTPLVETIRQISELPVTGLQLDLRDELSPTALSESGRRDFLHRLKERGLRIHAGWVPLRHPLYSAVELERRMTFLRDAMKFAWQLQARTLCLRCGQIPESLDQGDGQLLVELLTDLASYANHVGVTVAVTPTADTSLQLFQLLSRIKSGPIGLDFDPAHFAMQGLSVSEALRELHANVLHVQLRDGVRQLTGGGEEAAIGDGAVDWAELFALLGEMDYRGWLTAVRTQGSDRSGDIARGIHRLKRLVHGE